MACCSGCIDWIGECFKAHSHLEDKTNLYSRGLKLRALKAGDLRLFRCIPSQTHLNQMAESHPQHAVTFYKVKLMI